MISLSPFDLFAHAGPVGKAVMALLALVSVYAWVLIVEGVLAGRRLARALASHAPLLAPIVEAGRAAAGVSVRDETGGERRARIEEAMLRPARHLLEQAERGLTGLAITASAAPFVGLFGTVWGIITSFAAIGHAQDTSLAIVAPGIAEALAATAFGLAAAIPAVVGYNRIAAALGRTGGRLADWIATEALALAEGQAR